jgi:hypothetical protein
MRFPEAGLLYFAPIQLAEHIDGEVRPAGAHHSRCTTAASGLMGLIDDTFLAEHRRLRVDLAH